MKQGAKGGQVGAAKKAKPTPSQNKVGMAASPNQTETLSNLAAKSSPVLLATPVI